MSESLTAVITTIQPPTESVLGLRKTLAGIGATLVVAGDKKGPASFDLPGTVFLSLPAQLEMPFALAKLLPTAHYTRKNLAYLWAISRTTPCIYETDDDNAPNAAWAVRALQTRARKAAPRHWLNVYSLFSDAVIWPRGFPLDRIREASTADLRASVSPADEAFTCPIQQGLADLAPDVDAVWRLVCNQDLYFNPGPSIWLPPRTWCPFNSQSTWWWPAAYPLLYLPSKCSFRMTDIWRSFIAQRCLWEMGHGMIFHAAEVIQQRNLHNLMRDFADEVSGYLTNDRIVKELEDLKLESGPAAVSDNLIRCYEHLVKCQIFPAEEMPLVRAWVEDVGRLGS